MVSGMEKLHSFTKVQTTWDSVWLHSVLRWSCVFILTHSHACSWTSDNCWFDDILVKAMPLF